MKTRRWHESLAVRRQETGYRLAGLFTDSTACGGSSLGLPEQEERGSGRLARKPTRQHSPADSLARAVAVILIILFSRRRSAPKSSTQTLLRVDSTVWRKRVVEVLGPTRFLVSGQDSFLIRRGCLNRLTTVLPSRSTRESPSQCGSSAGLGEGAAGGTGDSGEERNRAVRRPDHRHGHQLGGIDQTRRQLLPALKISYVNAISVICEATGANVQEVAAGMGMDGRIGRRFLDASLGFGGSCFPKDFSAFIKISEQLGYDFGLLKEVQRINADQMTRFLRKITETLWILKDKTIGVLGLAFKQNTDDIRLSPAIELCHRLQKEGAALRVHDPKAMDKARAVLKDVTYVEDMNAVAEGCDALVVATEWPVFKTLDLERARKSLSHPILFDGGNLFDAKEMERLGFIYKSIGR